MRSTLITLMAIGLASLSGFCQSVDADPRLSERFSEAEILQMKQDDPEKLMYWNYYLDNSISIMSMENVEYLDFDRMPVIEASSEGFHAFTMDLNEYRERGAYLKFKGEDKIVLVKPLVKFDPEFEDYIEQTK